MTSKFTLPVILFSFLFLFTQCSKQDDQIPESKSSMKFHVETGVETIYKSIATSDGGILHVGLSGVQAYMLKLSPEGDKQWLQTYGQNGKEFFYDVVEASNGDFIAVGGSTNKKPGVLNSNSSGYVVRTDANGNLKWKYIMSDWIKLTNLNCVKEDPDGNIICGGYYTTNGVRSLILKLTPDGSQSLLEGYYPGIGPYNTIFKDITFTQDGNYIFWGLESPSAFVTEIRKVHVNRVTIDKDNARILSSYFYPEIRNEGDITSINTTYLQALEDADGQTRVITGSIDLVGSRYVRYGRFNPGGDLLDSKMVYRGENVVPAYAVLENGKVVIAGGIDNYSISGFSNRSQMIVFEIDLSGTVVWENRYGNSLGGQMATAYVKNNESFSLSGLTNDATSGKTKFIYLKSDRSGKIQ